MRSPSLQTAPPRPALFSALVLVSLSACGKENRREPASTRLLASIEQAVTFQRDLRLEENQAVINVSPRVTPEADGSFLVSDGKEQQVRFYASDGRLLGTFGRRGSGPGEFQNVTRAVRLNDRSILAADMVGGLTVFDSTGTRVLRTVRTGLGPIYEVQVLDDSVVAIVGRQGGQLQSPLVHEWNLETGRVSRSYFPAPQGPPGLSGEYALTGFADLAARGDTLAVLFALQDTIHLFLRGGRQIGVVPVAFRGFRRLHEPLADNASPDGMRAWLESFSAATDVFWLNDGSFLVQYVDQERSDRLHSLLHMRRNGEPSWEVSHGPRLLAVAPDGSLVFVKPGAEAPNQWSIATLASRR